MINSEQVVLSFFDKLPFFFGSQESADADEFRSAFGTLHRRVLGMRLLATKSPSIQGVGVVDTSANFCKM